ncbi:hypothetical protein GCM10009038_15520 [Salinicola rhizosphaerae]|uniref:Uncharacterized protein n=1 Tax=Salinicola rhizosphaerae TaxID=1443141 RepID=A0ABQ3E0X0_9GAMM|nr:hypothetical protein GCM10009038_15520 [Salinicola rhizosphaerae]
MCGSTAVTLPAWADNDTIANIIANPSAMEIPALNVSVPCASLALPQAQAMPRLPVFVTDIFMSTSAPAPALVRVDPPHSI